jgi:hypothetical protein
MLKAFERKLQFVRLRCSVNLLLDQMGRVLTAAGVVAVLAVLTERLLALSIINSWSVWSFLGAAVALVFLLWLLNHPSRLQVSLLLDERLKLHERFSTTLALSSSQDPFARAARLEAYETARNISPQGHFPIRPSSRWAYVVSMWLIAVALLLFMPPKDLLGYLKKRQQKEQQAEKTQLAEAAVKDTTSTVKSALKQLGDPELAEALAGLDQIPKGAKPDDIKRQAIRKLGDLSDKIKNMQAAGVQLDCANLMRQMFKQLPGSSDVFSQKLRLSLAQGNFSQASSLLKQMQKELLEGKLSDQQRSDLSQQLQELAKQLQELAAKSEQLEKELEKAGLNKSLAKLGEKQLREALQKQGLSDEKIEQLLQKAAACRMASGRCAGLGQAMGACGAGTSGLSGDELAALTEQLDELEAMKQQLMLTQAALDQIAGACASLGQGMGQGLGKQGPFSKGFGRGSGPGTGGPGIGVGPRAIDESGQTSTKKAKVPTKTKKGPVIASWYIKGSQIKGEAKRDFSEVIQAASDSAAEAISENQIPRKYEEAVKSYFGRLEQSRKK